MELYGVAIGVVPSKKDYNAMKMTCTPIAVSDASPDTFRILDDLKFEHKFNATSTKEVMGCFVKAVGVIDRVVKLQEKSLAEYGLAYRPVALDVGQDSRNPVNVGALHMHLFGGFRPLMPEPRQIEVRMGGRKPEKLIVYAPNTIHLKGVKKAHGARREFFERHKRIPHNFAATCDRFATLLEEKCVLNKGSFAHGEDKQTKDRNEEIKELWHRVEQEQDPNAHSRLRFLAKEKGREYGEMTTKNPNVFGYEAPKGYVENKQLQQERPSYAFYHWDEAYKKAFYEGFHETYIGPRVRHVKLPLDPPKPFFTDPCADMIREQFEIIKGRRSEDGILDETERRMAIAAAARNTAKELGHGKGFGSRAG